MGGKEAEKGGADTAAPEKKNHDKNHDAGALKRVPMPDNAKKDAKLRELSEKIDKLIEQRNVVDKSQSIARAGSKPFMDKKKGLVKEHKIVWNKRKQLMNEANAIRDRIEVLKASENDKRKKERAMRDQLKFGSVKDVDAKIAVLERRHETTSMSNAEEKALMKEIEQLRKTRRKVEDFLQQKSAGSKVDSIPTLRDEMKKKRLEADQFKPEIDRLSKELDVLTESNSATQKKLESLQKKRNKIQEELNGLFAEKDEIKRKSAQEWKEFKEYMDALNKKRDEERAEREKQFQKEREEYEAELEKIEMAKKPWEEEIALCDFLIQYLEGKVKKKAPTNKESKPDKPAAPVESVTKDTSAFDGLQAVGKKSNEESDFMVMGGGKSKKSKKKKKPAQSRLTHSMDLLGSFSLLNLTAPTKLDDIPGSIKELQEKKAYYDILPRAPRKKKGTETAPSQEGENTTKKGKSKKSKAPPPSVENAELFPDLPGSKVSGKPQPSSPPSGPSAVDLVKSSSPTAADAMTSASD